VKHQVVWLDGAGVVDADEVGTRAAVLGRLRAGGVPVPRGFVLGRTLFHRFHERVRRDAAFHVPVKLPPEVQQQIVDSVRALGGSFAIRRSPFEGVTKEKPDWMTTTLGGRPERETYLNLTDPAEVGEAVRRVWGSGLLTSPPAEPVAILVQRFMAPDVCALVRRDRADPHVLHVASTLGIGDLLAAGLVVPDRHTIRRDGHVLGSSLGRKAQMTVARAGGGVARVPVPAHAARLLAMDEPKVAELAAAWRDAEGACEGLQALGLSWSGGKWYVTSASAAQAEARETLMLG
jgi:hypothetical protein